MDDKPESREESAEDGAAGGGDEGGDGKTLNDPLTQGDVEAPRAEFRGRKPE